MRIISLYTHAIFFMFNLVARARFELASEGPKPLTISIPRSNCSNHNKTKQHVHSPSPQCPTTNTQPQRFSLIPSHGQITEMVARGRFELPSRGPKPSNRQIHDIQRKTENTTTKTRPLHTEQ